MAFRRRSVFELIPRQKRQVAAIAVPGPSGADRSTGLQYFLPDELVAFFDGITTVFSDRPDQAYWFSYFLLQYHAACRISEPALIKPSEDVHRTFLMVARLKKRSPEVQYATPYVKIRFTEPIKNALWLITAWRNDNDLSDHPFLFPSRMKPAHKAQVRTARLRRSVDGSAVSRFTAMRVMRRVMQASPIIPKYLKSTDVLKHTRAIVTLAMAPDPEKMVPLISAVLDHPEKRVRRYLPVAEWFAKILPTHQGMRLLNLL